MGFFESDVEFELPKQLRPLASMLTQRAKEAPPEFPKRQVAEADPLQELAARLTGAYAGSGPSQAYTTALGEATKTATTPIDVTNLPEFQAVINQIASYGQREANRTMRGGILTGNAPWRSSAGRDVLGRSVAETQERMMAAAVPFLQLARAEKQRAVEQLQSLGAQGEASQLSKIEAGSRVGEILRGIQAAKLEAEYQNRLDPLRFRYETQPQLAGVAFGAPYQSVAQPSDFAQTVAGISGIKDIGTMIAGLL